MHVGVLIREAPPSRLEVLAAQAGTSADELRGYLRSEIRRRRIVERTGNVGLAVHACDAANGDPLLALAVALDARR